MVLTPLTHPQDTLLFCAPSMVSSVIEALEDGWDQVVALCVTSDNADSQALDAAVGVIGDAARLDLPLFLDTRKTADLGAVDLGRFQGAVCLTGQVKFLRKSMDSDATLVVDAGISRHDAITGAEVGADAVLFTHKLDQVAAEIYPDDDEGPQGVASLYMWWEQMMEAPAVLDLDSLDEPPTWMKQVEFVAVQSTRA